jgi:DedD protein
MARYFDEDELQVDEPRQDTELTLSWTALAGMGLGLLAICALCFGLGYMAGHHGSTSGGSGAATAGSPPSSPPSASDQEPLQGSGSVPKPSASAQAAVPPPATDNAAQNAAPGGASPNATASSSGASAQGGSTAGAPLSQPQVRPALEGNAPDSGQAGLGPNVRPAMPSTATLMVQVAAVRNAEDANVLTDALRKRGYPASEQREAGDGLIHVRVGPFATAAEANNWKMKLLNDGYNAIVQP